MSVWRTKQNTVYKMIGCLYIAHVIACIIFYSLYMIHRVIARMMTSFQDFFIQTFIAGYIFTYTKKSGFYLIIIQQIKYPRSYFRHGTVVESKINGFIFCRLSPYRFGVQHTIEKGRSLYKHENGKKIGYC